MNNLANPEWGEEDILWLRENVDLPYGVLSEKLKRSVRAVKHKVYALGLKRSEKARWSDEELIVLRENAVLSVRELREKGLLHRSEFSIGLKKREVMGTARKVPEFIESREIAWLFGAIFTDGHVTAEQLSFSQKDLVFLERVKGIIEGVGMKVTISKAGGYWRLWSCSVEYKRLLGKESWNPMSFLNVIDERFSWVKDDPYIWSFMGGVMDGDGCVKRGKVGNSEEYVRVEIGVKGDSEKAWLKRVMGAYGCVFNGRGNSIWLNGGKTNTEEFLKRIDCVIPRKQYVRKEYAEGVVKISYADAQRIIKEHHYLGTLPVGTLNYGFIERGMVRGAACFGWASRSKGTAGKRAMELKRFVLVENEKNLASRMLGAVLKKLKKEDICDVVVSYADEELHVGTIYKAVGFTEVSRTGEQIVYVAPDGGRIGGRFALETMRARGLDPGQMRIEVVKGKRKFMKELTG